MKPIPFWLSVVILLSTLSFVSHAHPAPNKASPKSAFRKDLYKQSPRSIPKKPVGVWRITKYASLLGPTVAIYLYEKVHEIIERHEPLLTAKLQHFVQQKTSDKNGTVGTHVANIYPARSLRNPYVMKIANEIVRITNKRLRERAVLSRIQMDDDQYEFSQRTSAADVQELLLQVTSDVITRGSGQFLKSEEKRAVRELVQSSVY